MKVKMKQYLGIDFCGLRIYELRVGKFGGD
jgi:hypothetical protein